MGMQKGKQIIIRLKTNTKLAMKLQMKLQMDRMRKFQKRMNKKQQRLWIQNHNYSKSKHPMTKFGANAAGASTRLKQWRRMKLNHFTKYYKTKQLLIKEWMLRNAKYYNAKRLRGFRFRNQKEYIPYTKHTVTIHEPFQTEWFSKNDGYPLTAKDPRTDRFVNPWNSESTNGFKRLADIWRWKKTRMIGYDLTHSLDKNKNNNNNNNSHTNDDNNNN